MRPPAGQFAAWGSRLTADPVSKTTSQLVEVTFPVPVVWRVFLVNTTANGCTVTVQLGLGRVSENLPNITVASGATESFEVPARQLAITCEVPASPNGALSVFCAPVYWPWGVDPADVGRGE